MYCASQHKFFGPHLGVLYGKHDLLDRLRAYKVRPAPDDPPSKYEMGTQNHRFPSAHNGDMSHSFAIGQSRLLCSNVIALVVGAWVEQRTCFPFSTREAEMPC
jgi:hypothetical protein